MVIKLGSFQLERFTDKRWLLVDRPAGLMYTVSSLREGLQRVFAYYAGGRK